MLVPTLHPESSSTGTSTLSLTQSTDRRWRIPSSKQQHSKVLAAHAINPGRGIPAQRPAPTAVRAIFRLPGMRAGDNKPNRTPAMPSRQVSAAVYLGRNSAAARVERDSTTRRIWGGCRQRQIDDGRHHIAALPLLSWHRSSHRRHQGWWGRLRVCPMAQILEWQHRMLRMCLSPLLLGMQVRRNSKKSELREWAHRGLELGAGKGRRGKDREHQEGWLHPLLLLCFFRCRRPVGW